MSYREDQQLLAGLRALRNTPVTLAEVIDFVVSREGCSWYATAKDLREAITTLSKPQ